MKRSGVELLELRVTFSYSWAWRSKKATKTVNRLHWNICLVPQDEILVLDNVMRLMS